MLGLALAGCAQSRSALPKRATATEPVALTPVPSIHDTINRGRGGAKLSQSALGDRKDPRWSGRAPVSIATQSGAASRSDLAQGPPQPAAASSPPGGSPE